MLYRYSELPVNCGTYTSVSMQAGVDLKAFLEVFYGRLSLITCFCASDFSSVNRNQPHKSSLRIKYVKYLEQNLAHDKTFQFLLLFLF